MPVYFGEQTALAYKNFPFPVSSVPLELIYAITRIKKAIAKTNLSLGKLTPVQQEAIHNACEEILAGKHDESFSLPYLQGGAGTSINMNVNEVIAKRANELLEEKESTPTVHSLDHVNMYQSTNDVNPSALRIALLGLFEDFLQELQNMIGVLAKKSEETKHILKIGRTHMQDAVPITFSDEFLSYKATLERHKMHIWESKENLFELNLGGTAVGNSINVPPGYIEHVYQQLQEESSLPVRPAENFMALTSSSADFVFCMGSIHALTIDLSKMASDLRFLSSGPGGGIGEITLADLQKGSSIMPGKVNPVIPESINQLNYFVSGKYTTLTQAAENGHLELAVMFPIIAEALISSVKVTTSLLKAFTQCIETLTVNTKRSRELLEQTTGYATLFTPALGYDVVSEVIKEAHTKKRSFKEILIEKSLITQEQFETTIETYLKNKEKTTE